MNAIEQLENSPDDDNLSGSPGTGPSSKSSLAEINQILSLGPTSEQYASALSEYRLRHLRLLRQISDNQRRTTLTMERFAEHAGKSIRRIHGTVKVLIGVVAFGIAAGTSLAVIALVRFW